MKTFVITYAIWNIIVLLIYGFDKLQSKKGGRRVSEKSLLASALLMGGAGALTGMLLFRHKTKHTNFLLLVPFFLLLNIAVLWWIGQKI